VAEITGVPKLHALYSRNGNCEMNEHYATGNRELPKDGSAKIRIQMLVRPSIRGSLL
jgi:hypothetical protein